MENYKNNFGYFTPSYYSTTRNIPAFQGWIEPFNLTATQTDKESEKNTNEISTHTSEDLEDETSINGKKAQKNARDYAGITYKLQNLSRSGKKTCQFSNQFGLTKVGISFKKKCQSLTTKKPIFNAKAKFATSKTFTRMQSRTTSKVGQHHKRLPSLTSSMKFYQVEML